MKTVWVSSFPITVQGSGWRADLHFFFLPGAAKSSDPSAEHSSLLGAEKSNSPGAQGVIKVLLHAFLASPKKKQQSLVKVRQSTSSAPGEDRERLLIFAHCKIHLNIGTLALSLSVQIVF